MNKDNEVLVSLINTGERKIGQNKSSPRTCCLIAVAVFGGLGGFGLGASSYNDFNIFNTLVYDKAWMFNLIINSSKVAAVLSAIISGFVAYFISLKYIVIIGSILTFTGACLSIISMSYAMSLIGQFMIGTGLGAVVVGGLMYVREMSNDKYRNVMLTVFGVLYSLGRVFGVVFEISANESSSKMSDGFLNTWRVFFLPTLIAPLIMLPAFILLPYTPRWSMYRRKRDEARRTLKIICHTSEVNNDYQILVEERENNWRKSVTNQSILNTLYLFVAGCGVHFISILSQEAIIYSIKMIQKIEQLHYGYGFSLTFVVVPLIFTLISLALVYFIEPKKLIIMSILLGFFYLIITFGAGQLIQQHTSPDAIPLYKDYNQSNSCFHMSCSSCINDPNCGYCTIKDKALSFTGTCSPGTTKKSLFEVEYNCGLYQNFTDAETVNYQPTSWYYDFCPVDRHSRYKYMIIVYFILALAFLNLGLMPQTWTVNASIYPIWCLGPAIGFSTAFNLAGDMINGQVIDHLHVTLSVPYTILLLSCLLLAGVIFVVFALPTKTIKSDYASNNYSLHMFNYIH